MGTTSSNSQTDPDVLKMYEMLINMEFAENIAMEAAKKHPKDLNKAINYITILQTQITENVSIKSRNLSDDIGEPLDGLIDALKYHQMHTNNESYNNEKITEYFNVNKYSIMNDYHYILSNHLNEDNVKKSEHNKQFKLIYDKIMDKDNNLRCDISKCNVYRRNNRERESNKNDDNVSIAMDILDCIHCYFLHSVDVGYRIIDGPINDSNDNEDNICSDQQLFALKTYLKSKRESLSKIRGMNRIKNNKFITDFDQKSYGIDEEKKNESESDSDYNFGLRYNCWNNGYYDYELSAKYSSLKEEIISNNIYILEKTVFESAYDKAQCLMNESDTIKGIRCNGNECFYNIKSESSLNIDNILSIILYTDYDTLSYNFSSIFRKSTGRESDEYLIQRGNEYYHWIKIVTETVNSYGTSMKDSNINRLYHGVSFLYFNKFIAQFDCPTSTTTQLSVAVNFAKNDGIILELTKYDEYLLYFNCAFMSYFGNEDERLFIQPPSYNFYQLKLAGIRNMKTDENYGYFINVLATFQRLMNSRYHYLHDNDDNVSLESIAIMNDLMDISSNIDNVKYPNYIINSFQKWADKITKIDMDRSDCKHLNIWDFNIINDENKDNLIRYDKIIKVFKQITLIRCSDIGPINVWYLFRSLLIIKSLNDINYSKLKYITLFDIEIKFSTSEFNEYKFLLAQNGWILQKGVYGAGVEKIYLQIIKQFPEESSMNQADDDALFAQQLTAKQQQQNALQYGSSIYKQNFAKDWQKGPKNEKSSFLGALFSDPLYKFTGSLEEAKKWGSRENKWVLVNIQDTHNFCSHCLNRDIWKDKELGPVIKNSFIFYQLLYKTDNAKHVINMYQLSKFPCIVVLNPMTGKQEHEFIVPHSPDKIYELKLKILEFLDDFPSPTYMNQSVSLNDNVGQQNEVQLEPEPDDNDPNVTAIRIRMPNGAILQRSFKKDAKINQLYIWCRLTSNEQKISLLQTMPRLELDDKKQSTLKELQLIRATLVCVCQD